MFVPHFPHFSATFCSSPFWLNAISYCFVWQVIEKLIPVLFNWEKIVLMNNDSVEMRSQGVINTSKTRMKRVCKSGFGAHLVSHAYVAIAYHSWSHFVVHFPSGFVANPGVNTTTPREYPKYTLEVEVIRQNFSKYEHGNLEIFPALFAHLSSCTARSHIVIVIHVNIEHHFLLSGNECFFVGRVVSIWWQVVDSPDVNLVRNSVDQGLFELFCSLKAEVAAVDIVCQSERKLSIVEVSRRNSFIKTN